MLYHGGSKETIASPSRFLLPIQPCYEENMACSLNKERRNMWLHFSGRNLSLLIRANLFGERNSAHSDISAPLAWPLAFIHPKLCLRQSKLQQSVLLQWKHFKVLTWPSFTFHVQLTATQTQEKTKFSSQLTLTMPASEVLQLEHVPRSN